MIAADGIKSLERKALAIAHMRYAGVVVCMLACVGVGMLVRGGPKAPSIPPKEAKSLDSLFSTYPVYTRTRQATIVAERAAVDTAERAAKASASSYDSSTFYKRLADSLTQQASNHLDTAAVTWEGIAVVRSAEAATARHAADSLRVALTDMRRAKDSADARATGDSARVVSLTDALNRTAADLRAADPPCRVLKFVRCPSRRSVAVVGVALGVAAAIAIPHALK